MLIGMLRTPMLNGIHRNRKPFSLILALTLPFGKLRPMMTQSGTGKENTIAICHMRSTNDKLHNRLQVPFLFLLLSLYQSRDYYVIVTGRENSEIGQRKEFKGRRFKTLKP